MRFLRHTLLSVLAIAFLFEAWIWDAFRALGAWIVAAVPFERLKARIAAAIAALPPWAALLLFLIPVAVILPFKIGALWLIARGHIVLGAATFFAAKVAGVGAAAFIYGLTSEKLLSMAWFRRSHAIVMAWRDWAHRLVAPYRAQIVAMAAVLRARAFGDDASAASRLLTRLRRRARQGLR